MNKLTIATACVVTGIFTSIAFTPAVSAVDLYSDEKSTIAFNGNLSAYYLTNGDVSQVEDGFSRYYFDFSHHIKYDWQAIAKLEWGVQLSNTDDRIIVNHNGLTSTGPTSDNTWLRQGYVGVSHQEYGHFTLGKQWGVSYDVGGVTDVFEVFGAEASGTYNFGTDGGFSGSGRAEQALQYTVDFQKFTVAVQYLASNEDLQVFGENGEDLSAVLNFDDAYGLSVLYQGPYELGFGLAYNTAELSIGANGQKSRAIDDELITAHVTYRPYGSLGLHVALVLTDMKNHDINDLGQVMAKSKGIELFSAYRFDNDISLIAGYNSLKDHSSVNTINPNVGSDGSYHKEYFILSAKYHWDEDFYLYIESKFDRSTLAAQSTSLAEDATGIGMMFTF